MNRRAPNFAEKSGGVNSKIASRERLIRDNELPNLPDKWDVERFRYLFSESKERNGDTPIGEMLSVSEYRGVVPKEYEHEQQKRTEAELQTYKVVRPGQLAVNSMWLNHLGLGVSEYGGHISPAYAAYNISPRLDKRFTHHLMRSKYYLNIYMRYLYGIRPNSFQIKTNDWMSIPIIVPPLETQKQIADFLDRETGRIDELIGKKDRLIKMLDVRFDSYLNEVMSGYEERKLKTMAFAQLSGVDKHIYEDEIEVRVVHYTDAYYNDSITHSTKLPLGSVSALEKWRFILKGGEVVITKDSETPEDIAIPAYIENVEENTVCGYHLAIIRPNSAILDGRFLFWGIKTKHVRDYFCLAAQGVTRYGIPIGKISDCPLPYVSSIEEQKKLGIELFSKNSRKNELIKKIRLSMDQLKQFRSSLITEAITGQLDINQWKTCDDTDRELEKIEASTC